MLKSIQILGDEKTSYAAIDCVRSFDKEMRSLYLLSFLLTADRDQAERCLISAIGECAEGFGVLEDWEHSWNRRTVFKHAIQMITPAPEHADNVPLLVLKHPVVSAANNPFAKVLSLGAFERFVFVMSILEGVSDEECAMLLNCSQRDVVMARVLALLRQSSTAAQSE